MMVPTIHLNGTSRESLLEGYEKAHRAVRAALKEVAEIGPNGRDFYPQGPDALSKASDEHRARMNALSNILRDLEALGEAIDNEKS